MDFRDLILNIKVINGNADIFGSETKYPTRKMDPNGEKKKKTIKATPAKSKTNIN